MPEYLLRARMCAYVEPCRFSTFRCCRGPFAGNSHANSVGFFAHDSVEPIWCFTPALNSRKLCRQNVSQISRGEVREKRQIALVTPTCQNPSTLTNKRVWSLIDAHMTFSLRSIVNLSSVSVPAPKNSMLARWMVHRLVPGN